MARPRLIDRTSVLRASLAVADEGGLDGVTMQAVADRLGVTPMALYRHVDGKADLLDGLVESLLDEIDAGPTDGTWDEHLSAMGRSLRATARRHPAVFPLLLQLPASTPGAKRARQGVYLALSGAGVADEDLERVERLISTMVLGFAASEVSGRFGRHPRAVLDADYRAMEEIVRGVVTSYRQRRPQPV